ncbi:MAG: HD-GYP domain-containing protein [bacterium]
MLELDLVRLLLSLSRSLDFAYGGLLEHHQRVAFIALSLGRAAGLTDVDLRNIFTAAIIHDAGAVTWQEKLSLVQFDVENPWDHGRRGYEFTQDIDVLGPVAPIVLSHHDYWAGDNPSGLQGESIPLASRIIHLSDRVDVLLEPDRHVLDQAAGIIARIQSSAGTTFDPDLVYLLQQVAATESFWLDLTSPWLGARLLELIPTMPRIRYANSLLQLSRLFARVVDAKSPYTHRHSQGVASTARFLGEKLGLSPAECDLLEVAGLLHDLGKVTVPEEILEKPGKLTPAEFNIIKQHTYYTYWLLEPLLPNLPLAEWAAYHHERLDGQGYPFPQIRPRARPRLPHRCRGRRLHRPRRRPPLSARALSGGHMPHP